MPKHYIIEPAIEKTPIEGVIQLGKLEPFSLKSEEDSSAAYGDKRVQEVKKSMQTIISLLGGKLIDTGSRIDYSWSHSSVFSNKWHIDGHLTNGLSMRDHNGYLGNKICDSVTTFIINLTPDPESDIGTEFMLDSVDTWRAKPWRLYGMTYMTLHRTPPNCSYKVFLRMFVKLPTEVKYYVQ